MLRPELATQTSAGIRPCLLRPARWNSLACSCASSPNRYRRYCFSPAEHCSSYMNRVVRAGQQNIDPTSTRHRGRPPLCRPRADPGSAAGSASGSSPESTPAPMSPRHGHVQKLAKLLDTRSKTLVGMPPPLSPVRVACDDVEFAASGSILVGMWTHRSFSVRLGPSVAVSGPEMCGPCQISRVGGVACCCEGGIAGGCAGRAFGCDVGAAFGEWRSCLRQCSGDQSGLSGGCDAGGAACGCDAGRGSTRHRSGRRTPGGPGRIG